jgi:hypothetical protein
MAQDAHIIGEIDVIVNEFRRRYVIETEKTWVDEVRRATKALEKHKNFWESPEHIVGCRFRHPPPPTRRYNFYPVFCDNAAASRRRKGTVTFYGIRKTRTL